MNQSFRMPVADVEEYPHDEILKFEKETLGVYISGHPLDEYEQLWKNTITATSSDFVIDEEIGRARVEDNQICVIGGIVESITKKVTKNGDTMAFATIEDLVGSVEVLIFPKTYDKCRDIAIEGAMIFVSGRVSTGDDTMAKVICQNIIPFDKVPKYVWLRFDNRAAYDTLEKKLSELIQTSHGNDEIYIYLDKEKQKKKLPANQNIKADDNMIRCIQALIGPENVKITFAKIKS